MSTAAAPVDSQSPRNDATAIAVNPTPSSASVGEDSPSAGSVPAQHTVTVLFFAKARDLAGVPECELSLPVGATAKDCIARLVVSYPLLASVLPTSHLAVNQEYADESTVIPRKAEVAVIPPVSGG